MLTAMQAARIRTANNLFGARDQLFDTISSICWQNGESRQVNDVINDIDKLIGKLVPNQPAEMPEDKS